MRPALFVTLVVSIVAVLVLVPYLRDREPPGAEHTLISDSIEHPPADTGEPRVKAETATPEQRSPGKKSQPAPTVEHLAQELYDQSIIRTVQDFRADLQAFVREAQLLPAQDHEPRARELLAEVDELSAAAYLTGPEALALRLSLLKYALPADEYRDVADTLVSEARQRAESAEREWASRSDPKLEYYRSEERRIVEQSAAMTEFPEGMTRQAYLRERLLELRIEVFTE